MNKKSNDLRQSCSNDTPKDWKIVSLKDMVHEDKPIVYGIVQAGLHVEDGIPYIKSSDIRRSVDLKSLQRTSLEIAGQYKRSEVRPGDIVFSLRGNIGACCIVPDDIAFANLTQGTARISVKESICKDYVYYALQTNTTSRQIAAVAKGSTFQEISLEELRKLSIPLPPLSEQRKIAEILSTWDEAIDLTEQLIAAKQRRKQALMQRLLTGQVRFPGFTKLWRNVLLKEFLTPVVRKVEKPQESYIALSVRSHGKGTFRRIVDDPDEVAMTELFQVQRDDLVVNITFAWEGAIAIVNKEDTGCYVSHRFPTYQFDENVVVRNFFRYVMVTKRFFHELGLISPGGAGRNRVLSKTDFLNICISVPEVSEQQKIADLLVSCDQELDLHQRKLAALRRQKQGLMQQLLTGKLRVKG